MKRKYLWMPMLFIIGFSTSWAAIDNRQEDKGLTFSNSSSKERIYKWLDGSGRIYYGDVRPNETLSENSLEIFNLQPDQENGRISIENISQKKRSNR